jgi:hypothetical protein
MFIPVFILIAIAILIVIAIAIGYLSGSIRAYDNAIEWHENAAKYELMFPRTHRESK